MDRGQSFENSVSSDAAVHGIDVNDIDSVVVLNNDLHTHYLNDVFNDIMVIFIKNGPLHFAFLFP